MKAQKHLIVAGAAATDLAEIATFLRVVQPQLDHSWSLAGEDDVIDLVLADLTDFGGRCARVRALDEGRHFAALADPGADVLDADLVVLRPIRSDALAGMLNHVGSAVPPEQRRYSDFNAPLRPVVSTPSEVENSDAADSGASPKRAQFLAGPRARTCTDLDALVQGGAVLLERAGLAPLLIDPVTDTYRTTARLIDLEPYFLKVVSGPERRRIGGAQLAALCKELAPQPLERLRWLRALLRSNGWLAEHLDRAASYRLKRWFHIDTDYRKQHRIALTLMRGAPLHRIAASSKAQMADVYDVVNAFDALGLIAATPRPVRDEQMRSGRERWHAEEQTMSGIGHRPEGP